MRFSQLILEGFKSFADRTSFDFHPRMTGIVGPRGCGKTVLVDAIRWVLGESSLGALRANSPGHLIFRGTDRRKPRQEAEVSSYLGHLKNHLRHRQLIVLTYQKQTMSLADAMYGVTMEEYGVSMPVGMRLTNL